MQKIILVRHAKALDRFKAKEKKISDKNRPLTAKGIREFIKHIKKHKKIFNKTDLYVTSPYIRAVETLDVMLDTLKLKDAEIGVMLKIRPESDVVFLKQWLRKRKEKKIVIVSHEPFLSQFILNVMKNDIPDEYRKLKIKKGGIIEMDYDSDEKKFKMLSLINP